MMVDDGTPTPDGLAHYLLLYEYVDDMLERRAPHRDSHLAHVRTAKDDGRIVMAGALGDPPRGAALVFRVEDAEEVARFADADPYRAAGLITERRIERWIIV